ncbi:hypothetical protein [Streptomyces fulvorobeus]|nr:hypothetical protein [Streptomyces fulvorobeus]NYE44803.1 hypothetical protein [Streptomyces fulvorobeus]
MSYLSGTPSAVEAVDRDLKELNASGVPAADRLLASWLKKLEHERAKQCSAGWKHKEPGEGTDSPPV